MIIKIKRLRDQAKLPSYAHPSDAGLDLYAPESFTLQPSERRAVPLGIAIELPDGYAAFIKDKSGLARHSGIHNLAGVCDAGYRGEYTVVLINLGQIPVAIAAGEKISQLVIFPKPPIEVVEVDELSPSARGQSGFGSTGKF